MANNFYNEILTEHNVRPEFKYDLPDATIKLEGVNPNCGDDIFLNLKLEDGIIQDASFCGDGCAISQASADIMIGSDCGKDQRRDPAFIGLFLKMIKGTATEEEVDVTGRGICVAGYFPYASTGKVCGIGMENLAGSIGKDN